MAPKSIADDPFGQGEWYYSESARELIALDDMPPQYIRNAMRKLEKDFSSEFKGSVLEGAMISRLIPTTKQAMEIIEKGGRCLSWCPRGSSRSGARGMFYYIGKRLGKKVKTHKIVDAHGDCWIEGFIATDMQVTARAVRSKVGG